MACRDRFVCAKLIICYGVLITLRLCGHLSLWAQGTEPKATFTVGEGRSVEAVAAHSKGFVVGLDAGLVAFFDRDERDYYKLVRTFTIHDHPQRVR